MEDNQLLQELKSYLSAKEGEEDLSHPLLKAKNVMMESYVTNLLYILALRASGKSLEGDPAIQRLIECRLVLEKLRPVLKNQEKQLSQLLSIGRAVERGEDMKDFKDAEEQTLPKLIDEDNIDSDSFSDEEENDDDDDDDDGDDGDDDDDDDHESKDEEEEEEEEEEESDNDSEMNDYEDIDSDELSREISAKHSEPPKKKKKTSSNFYQPPKMNAVYFDADERSKKRSSSESKFLLEEKLALLQEAGETPVEIKDLSSRALKQKKKEKEIQKYEESNMVRLNRDRKERRRNEMDEVMDLMEGRLDHPNIRDIKKKKSKPKRLNKKKFGKRR